ncbi:MAG TPA: hypothetical protein VEL28_13605 [Candidatus Binatia bacterium]|nr:hypothetical protein [Candidatus Binatia bacterium]
MSTAWPGQAGGAPAWAGGLVVPEWLALRTGSVPVVIVAPHGGRRRRAVRRGDSVNDLHTAEIAWELASRLDAHAIVNHGLDRNQIDLNRISHLADRAPDVLKLLVGAVEHAGGGDVPPLVLFVHGWNMVVPCCDVGVGLRVTSVSEACAQGANATTGASTFEDAQDRDATIGATSFQDVQGRHPTLSASAFEAFVGPLQRALCARGISTGVGRRYSASGRDNAAQLFSGRHREHPCRDVARLAELSMDGRVDAAQLELGIPLRWQGPLRDSLIDGLVEALQRWLGGTASAAGGVSSRGWCSEPAEPASAAMVAAEPGYALQAVLDRSGSAGLFCGVEATSTSSMAGRFCIVSTDGSMMLLVGEGSWSGERGRYDLEGFEWRSDDDGSLVRLRVRGGVIRYRSHDAYLDLEAGLADSELTDADVDLVYRATGPGHGQLVGTVRAGAVSVDVDTLAFLDRGGRRGGAQARMRVMMRDRSGQAIRVEASGDQSSVVMLEQADARAPLGRIRLENPGSVIEMAIAARVPVWRPAGNGVVARWTFGMARVQGGDEREAAIFDSLEIFSLPPR